MLQNTRQITFNLSESSLFIQPIRKDIMKLRSTYILNIRNVTYTTAGETTCIIYSGFSRIFWDARGRSEVAKTINKVLSLDEH